MSFRQSLVSVSVAKDQQEQQRRKRVSLRQSLVGVAVEKEQNEKQRRKSLAFTAPAAFTPGIEFVQHLERESMETNSAAQANQAILDAVNTAIANVGENVIATRRNSLSGMDLHGLSDMHLHATIDYQHAANAAHGQIPWSPSSLHSDRIPSIWSPSPSPLHRHKKLPSIRSPSLRRKSLSPNHDKMGLMIKQTKVGLNNTSTTKLRRQSSAARSVANSIRISKNRVQKLADAHEKRANPQQRENSF